MPEAEGESVTTVWKTPPTINDKCGETDPNLAINAADYITSSAWVHQTTELHWIIFDLGQSRLITKVRLFQPLSLRWGGASGLTVYVSDDPASWGTAVWEGVLNASGWQETAAFSKQGRYVKLVSLSNSLNQIMGEFQAQVTFAAFEACRERIAAILGAISITSPVAASILRVYEMPPETVEDVPCFILFPPALKVERGSSGRRVKTYTLEMLCLVSDEAISDAAAIVDAFREAVVDAFDSDLTLNTTATLIEGPSVERGLAWKYAGRDFIGINCVLTVVLKEARAFS